MCRRMNEKLDRFLTKDLGSVQQFSFMGIDIHSFFNQLSLGTALSGPVFCKKNILEHRLEVLENLIEPELKIPSVLLLFFKVYLDLSKNLKFVPSGIESYDSFFIFSKLVFIDFSNSLDQVEREIVRYKNRLKILSLRGSKYKEVMDPMILQQKEILEKNIKFLEKSRKLQLGNKIVDSSDLEFLIVARVLFSLPKLPPQLEELRNDLIKMREEISTILSRKAELENQLWK